MKIMLLVLHKLGEDMSKVIGPSISPRNFSILTNSKKVDKLMLSIFNP